MSRQGKEGSRYRILTITYSVPISMVRSRVNGVTSYGCKGRLCRLGAFCLHYVGTILTPLQPAQNSQLMRVVVLGVDWTELIRLFAAPLRICINCKLLVSRSRLQALQQWYICTFKLLLILPTCVSILLVLNICTIYLSFNRLSFARIQLSRANQPATLLRVMQ